MKRTMILAVIAAAFFSCADSPGGDSPLDGGLAGHWRFDGTAGNGSVAPDASGNGRDGRLHGQTVVEGVLGGALLFEGYDQVVEVGDLGVTAPATVSLWINTRDLMHDRRLLSQLEGGESQAGALRIDGAHVEAWDGSAWQVLVDRGMRINTWLHVAAVFAEDGRCYGYLNGEQQHLVRCGFDFAGVPAGIGAAFTGGSGNLYTGMMDDVRVYGRALSGEEVQALFGAVGIPGADE